MTLPLFSVRDISFHPLLDGFVITVTTDIPCHLYMRLTTLQPQIHRVPRLRRGIALHTDLYFCFTTFDENEQAEPGDKLIHTFIKQNWPLNETRHFYFRGEISGVPSVSTSPIFSLTLSATDYFLSGPEEWSLITTPPPTMEQLVSEPWTS